MKRMIFTKYSAERSRQFAIRTDIMKSENGELEVMKRALYPEGEEHIAHICRSFELLAQEYRRGQFALNVCGKREDGVRLAYLSSETLQQKLATLARSGREEEIKEYLSEYFARMREGDDWIAFEKTEEFVRVFGDAAVPEGLRCRRVTDIDIIFSNLIPEGKIWHLIDYEWTFEFPIPLNFVLYRACHLAANEIPGSKSLNEGALFQRLGIDRKQQECYAAMEEHFQEYIKGRERPVRDLIPELGFRVITPAEIASRTNGSPVFKIRSEYSYGSEDFAYSLPQEVRPVGENGVRVVFAPPHGAKRLRLSLHAGSSLIQVKSLLADTMERPPEKIVANGKELGGGLYLFVSDAARFEIPCEDVGRIEILLAVQLLDPSVNQAFLVQVNGLYQRALGEHELLEETRRELVLLKNSKYYKIYERLRRLKKRRPKDV